MQIHLQIHVAVKPSGFNNQRHHTLTIYFANMHHNMSSIFRFLKFAVSMMLTKSR